MTRKIHKTLVRLLAAILPAALLLLPGACTPLSTGDPSDRPMVPVSLSLDIAPAESCMPGTKADNESVASDHVKTVALLQFEWVDETEGNARLINQQFLQVNSSEDITKAILMASNVKNTVVVIANVPGRLPLLNGLTFSAFIEHYNYSVLSSLNDRAEGVWYCPPGSEDRFLRMNGYSVVEKVPLDGPISVTLKRSCAKVVIKVSNTETTSGVRIEKVQLRDINRRYAYLTNGVSIQDPFDVEFPFRFDNPEEPESDFPEEGNAGTVQEFTYYVPANLRGTEDAIGDSDADQYKKNWYAPTGATRFCIYAKDVADGSAVVYTFFLGKNLYNNFDLEPNKVYDYTFPITSKGSATGDSRIEEFKPVRQVVDANCYLLQPPTREARTYSFPVRRAAIFWNQTSYNMGLYNAATDVTGTAQVKYKLSETDEWTMEVIWQDMENYPGDDAFLLTTAGKGFNPANPEQIEGHQPWFSIQLLPGMRGNALVGIRKKTEPTEGDILWSWHIWVSDYDPDVEMTPATGTYSYPVPGGSLHRYNVPAWNNDNGAYKRAFAMDRNLGALAATGREDGIGVNEAYGLLYLWGRKDPFRWVNKTKTNADLGAPYWAIRYGVHEPMTVIVTSSATGNRWTAADDNVGDPNKNWNDPLVDQHALDVDGCEAGKSIYDPCPPGWKVFPSNPFKNFTTSGDNREWERVDFRYGWCYYPAGYDNVATTGYAYFPYQMFSYGSMVRNDRLEYTGRYRASYLFGQGIFRLYDTGAFSVWKYGNSSEGNLGSVRCVKMGQ